MLYRLITRLSACLRHGLPVLLLGSTIASAQPAPPPAEDFVRAPKLSGFVVSPSNRHAAYLVRADNGRQVAVVIDLEKPTEVRVIAGYADADVVRLMWINDKRLVYEAYHPGALIDPTGAGTFAVNLDGQDRRKLINWFRDNESVGTRLTWRELNYGWRVWRSWDGRSDDVLAYLEPSLGLGDRGSRKLVRLNTTNGLTQTVEPDMPRDAVNWSFDAQGQLRLVETYAQGRHRVFLRDQGQSAWVEIQNQAGADGQQMSPLYIERDGTVIVLSRRGRDTQALYTFDTRTRKLGDEPLAAARGFDVGSDIELDNALGQVVGVHMHTDRVRSVWFDEGLQTVQEAVDAALPAGRANRLLCGRCVSAQRLVVRSSNERSGEEFFIYDRQAKRLIRLGVQRPWLTEARLGSRTFHRAAARDGLSMPVVVTHPPGRDGDRHLPAVLLVHGGPWVRGAMLDWSADAQFLASRGYRVLEVDFRGSTGLGWKHFRSGWKQWGLAMQDDLADTVAWAVREGLVDGARVCIAGASYGGYAALMGPVRHPELYRCAISHVGVTDLSLLFDEDYTDVGEEGRRYGLPQMVGDPTKDAEQLRRQSPLHRAAEIKVPVLLVQGKLDRRVVRTHADRFETAARAAGVDIERVDYDDGHGWFQEAHHADYLRRVERLLARALKPAN
jgi:dipeptidyl aminopeptidase/acylaminoacyl peptidase